MKGWNRIARVLGALVLAAMACDLGNVPPGEPKIPAATNIKLLRERAKKKAGKAGLFLSHHPRVAR